MGRKGSKGGSFIPLVFLSLIVAGDHGVQAVQQRVLQQDALAPSLEGREAQGMLEEASPEAQEVIARANDLIAAQARFLAVGSEASEGSQVEAEASEGSQVEAEAQARLEPITLTACVLGLVVAVMAYRKSMRAAKSEARRAAVEAKLRDIADASSEFVGSLTDVLDKIVGDADTRLRETLVSLTLSVLSPGSLEHPAVMADDAVLALACSTIAKFNYQLKPEPEPEPGRATTLQRTSSMPNLIGSNRDSVVSAPALHQPAPAPPKILDGLTKLVAAAGQCGVDGKFTAGQVQPTPETLAGIRSELYSLVQHDLDNEIGADRDVRKALGLSFDGSVPDGAEHVSSIILGELSSTLGALNQLLVSDPEAEQNAVAAISTDPEDGSEDEDNGNGQQQRFRGTMALDIEAEAEQLQQQSQQMSMSVAITAAEGPEVPEIEQESPRAPVRWQGAAFGLAKSFVSAIVFDGADSAKSTATAAVEVLKGTTPPDWSVFTKSAAVLSAAGPLLNQLVGIASQIASVYKDSKVKKRDAFGAARAIGLAYERLEAARPLGVFNLCRLTQILRAEIRKVMALKPTSAEVQKMDITPMLGLSKLNLDPNTKSKLAATFFARLCVSLSPIYQRAGSLFRQGGICAIQDEAAIKAIERNGDSFKPVDEQQPQQKQQRSLTVVGKKLTPQEALVEAAQRQQKQVSSADGDYRPSIETCSRDDIYDIQLARASEIDLWNALGYKVVAMPNLSVDAIFPALVEKQTGVWDGELNALIKKPEGTLSGKLSKLVGSGKTEFLQSIPPQPENSRIMVYIQCHDLKNPTGKMQAARAKSPFFTAHLASLKEPITDLAFSFRKRGLRAAVGPIDQLRGKYENIFQTNGGASEFKRWVKFWKEYRSPVPIEGSDEEKRLVGLGYKPAMMLTPDDAKAAFAGSGNMQAQKIQGADPSRLFATFGLQMSINTDRNFDKISAEKAIFLYSLAGGASPLTDLQLHPFMTSVTNETFRSSFHKPEKISDVMNTEILLIETEFKKRMKETAKLDDKAALTAFASSNFRIFTMLAPLGCVIKDQLEPSVQAPKPTLYKERKEDAWARKSVNKMIFHHFSVTCSGLKPDQRWQRIGPASPYEDLEAWKSNTAAIVMPYVWALRRLNYPRNALEEGQLSAPACDDECKLVAEGKIFSRAMTDVAAFQGLVPKSPPPVSPSIPVLQKQTSSVSLMQPSSSSASQTKVEQSKYLPTVLNQGQGKQQKPEEVLASIQSQVNQGLKAAQFNDEEEKEKDKSKNEEEEPPYKRRSAQNIVLPSMIKAQQQQPNQKK